MPNRATPGVSTTTHKRLLNRSALSPLSIVYKVLGKWRVMDADREKRASQWMAILMAAGNSDRDF